MRTLIILPMAILLSGCLMERHIHGPMPLSKGDFINMHAEGVPQDDLVRLLGRNGLDSPLSADDIIEFKQSGMSDGLIQAAVEAPVRDPRDLPATVVVSPWVSPFEVFVAGAVIVDFLFHRRHYRKHHKRHHR